MSVYGLADCNNFFVSCERVFRPALEGRPAVVLSSNDGCIVARSDEAKALGVKMAQPAFQAKDLIERHSIAVISGNLQFYTDMSNRVMQIFGELAPAVEKYSIDECFLDLTGIPPRAHGICPPSVCRADILNPFCPAGWTDLPPAWNIAANPSGFLCLSPGRAEQQTTSSSGAKASGGAGRRYRQDRASSTASTATAATG